jgi:SagB-type dehydrogenase family enzyme
MKARLLLGLLGLGLAGVAAAGGSDVAVALPSPRLDGAVSVERALALRRSVREFADRPLPLTAVSQLLWAAQGVTDARGLRTAPSAGAIHPLEVILVAGRVSGLAAGSYRYEPRQHRLLPIETGDLRERIAAAALDQTWVAEAPAILVLTAEVERSARRYAERAPRYVQMEVGHAAQNVYLQAVALELATCTVGAFRDARLKQVLGLSAGVDVFALLPVGSPR